MFNRTANPHRPAPAPSAEGPPPRRAGPPPAPSILGAGLTFEGVVAGDGELQIEGALKGEVRVARLVIGEHARVEGAVRSGQVEVRGRVVGDIEARSVRLYETAHVEGDIVHEQLSIEVGAFFEGRCRQAKPSPAPSAEVIELETTAG